MFKSKFRSCFVFGVSLFSLVATHAAAKESVQSILVHADEEAFLVRRIAEFWKDGESGIVKKQIIDFLDHYPDSDFSQYFLGILGDIYLQERSYEQALSTYQMVVDQEVEEKILINKLQCYYELDQYERLINDARPFLSSQAPEVADRKEELYFLMGEAFFRQALTQDDIADQQELASKARKYYEGLPEGPYRKSSEFALAEIAAILKDHEKGAKAYRALAEKYPEMAENFLFQAASLEVHYNKLGAAQIFREVKNMKGEKEYEATLNLMVILFEHKEFEEILSLYEKVSPSIPESFQADFNFIVGKSFFSIGDFQSAIEPLQSYINSTFIPSDQLKNALLLQMTCAHQTKRGSVFDTCFEKFDTLFPNDQETPKALFMHAMILKEQGDTSQASEKLKAIKDVYPLFASEESFIFEHGLLAHQNKQWEESYLSFKKYVLECESSPRIDAAWRLYLSSAIHLYEDTESSAHYTQTQFFDDLHAVLDHSDCLNEKEQTDYALLYAKTAYELDRFSDALRCLEDHIFTRLKEKQTAPLAEAHFVAGLCHAKAQSDHLACCAHLEQAMALNPEAYHLGSTHLQLYNAYICLAGYETASGSSLDEKQQQKYIDLAAEHLEKAAFEHEATIKDDNRLWLANHYYQKVQGSNVGGYTSRPETDYALERACHHYQKLLLEGEELIDLTADNLHLEFEVVKFSKLLEHQNARQQRLFLIKTLLQQQSEKATLNWSSQKDALYELATIYKSLGEREKAFETYSFIHSKEKHSPSVLSNHATLEAARLRFDLLEDKARTATNEEVIGVLNDLKELQIRKNVFSEPTHLEAALEYAQIGSTICDLENRDERYLFLLSRMQEDFNTQEDFNAQDYLVNLNQNVEKKGIFDAYMKFVDAEMLRLKAKSHYKNEELDDIERLHKDALRLYNELKNDPNTPKNLYDKSVSGIHQIEALPHFSPTVSVKDPQNDPLNLVPSEQTSYQEAQKDPVGTENNVLDCANPQEGDKKTGLVEY